MGAWKHFDKYGEPLFPRVVTAEANRKRLVLEHCKPSKRPRGGHRGKPKQRVTV